MVESLDPETGQHPGHQTGTTDTEKLEVKISDQETEPAKCETEQIVKEEVEILPSQEEDSTEGKEPDVDENEEGTKEEQDDANNEEDIQKEKILKGILKRERTYSNKHVGFNTDVKFIPFDETKDYTIEIQFVKELTKVVKSYRELFQQMKEEKEREEREMLEEEEEEEEEEEQKREQEAVARSEEQKQQDKNVVQNNHSEAEAVNKSGNLDLSREPTGNKEIPSDQSIQFHKGLENLTGEEGEKMSGSQPPANEGTNNKTDKNHNKLDPRQELILEENNKQLICDGEETQAIKEINSVGHEITINANGP